MAWIESHQEIAHHPKTRKLARLLKVSVPAAIGHLHLLWWWALDYAEDGWLGRWTAEDVAEAAMWKHNPQILWDALCDCGWLDAGAEGSEIHDWETYAGRLIEQRKKDAERKRTSRSRPAPVPPPSAGRPPDIHDESNGHDADVRPPSDVTVPNRTVPNLTVENRSTPPPTAVGGPPLEFSGDERDLISEIEATLAPFGLSLQPQFWRKVLDDYGCLPLGMEAHKQADWLRRNHKRIASATRYTNWLDKALQDRQARTSPSSEEDLDLSPISGCPGCGKANWDVSYGPLCPACARKQIGAA